LDRLGVLWITGSINPVQENFMSYLIRQKIIVAIDSLPLMKSKGTRKFLLYLPEGETQELSLLFMYYLLKSRKYQVIYVGQNISIDDLKDVYQIHKPDYLFTMITETFSRQPVQQYVDMVTKALPATQILLSGYQVVAQKVITPENAQVLKSLEQTVQFLDEIGGARAAMR
jgi:hypothetical protein